MTAPRFFVDLPLAPGARVVLPQAVAHHAFRVLRLTEGAAITLFNGNGGEYAALLGRPQAAEAQLIAFDEVEREGSLDLTLIQALVAAEKLDWIVEKATELGAARILLVPAERSVVRLSDARLQRRLEHLRGVARAACEQCGRNRVPDVAPLAGLGEIGPCIPPAAARLVLVPGANWQTVLLPARAFAVAVGPEGGFTPAELAAAKAAGFVGAALGPRVLRTETAGMAALAALLARHGDFAGFAVGDAGRGPD